MSELNKLLPGRDLDSTREQVTTPIRRLLEETTQPNFPLGQILYLDSRFQLSDDLLGYSDRISMKSSLELRVPFLDRELTRWIYGLGDGWKVSLSGRRKILLRKVARRRLPEFVVERSKVGFETPYQRLLNGGLGTQFQDYVLESEGLFQKFDFDKTYLKYLNEAKGRGNRRIDRQVFTLLMLGLWAEEWGVN